MQMESSAVMGDSGYTVRRLAVVEDTHLRQLAEVLRDCVEGGASVNFLLPFSPEKAVAFWRKIAAGVAAGQRVLLVAEDDTGICGTVQLVLDLPENQPHRAEVAKLLVHRRARNRGVGAALMRAVDETARACGRTLLVLDTVTGEPAERLYTRLGWQRVGVVPQFALFPDGQPCSTTFFYRRLEPAKQS